MHFNRLATALLGSLLLGTPAQAVVISELATAPNAWALVDTTRTLAVDGTWTFQPSIRQGNKRADFLSPFDGRFLPGGSFPGFESIPYYSIGTDNPTTPANGVTAEMTFDTDRTFLTLLWGSIDTYNSIEFYLDNTLAQTVTNSDFVSANPVAKNASLVKISDLVFDEVHFISTSDAFEFSNVSTVPLPAGFALLLTGLAGLLGVRFVALRRRLAHV